MKCLCGRLSTWLEIETPQRERERERETTQREMLSSLEALNGRKYQNTNSLKLHTTLPARLKVATGQIMKRTLQSGDKEVFSLKLFSLSKMTCKRRWNSPKLERAVSEGTRGNIKARTWTIRACRTYKQAAQGTPRTVKTEVNSNRESELPVLVYLDSAVCWTQVHAAERKKSNLKFAFMDYFISIHSFINLIQLVKPA